MNITILERNMERDIVATLNDWKSSRTRKPLILRGARQVGKTWALKEFGRANYEQVAYFSLEKVNSEKPSEYAQFFEATNDPHRIVDSLSLAGGVPIRPESTLLILDEIQDCPAALNSLKYFYEDAPEFHVACAGSLLGVALASEEQSFPVGKVTFRDMGPATFSEFLRATGAANLDEYCRGIEECTALPDLFANQLSEKLQQYFAVGGMPEAVETWNAEHDFGTVDQVLGDLVDSYERDFAKHGGRAGFAKISRIWNSLPTQLARENKKFLFGLVREGARAREYEDALLWLQSAGLVRRVTRSVQPGIPLSSHDEENTFKLYCLDVGILRRLSRLQPSAFGAKGDMFAQFKGSFAENYALQALVTQLDASPRYWLNDKPRHEVDFLVQVGNGVVPIEVKSGDNVKSPSLSYYRRKYAESTPLAVRMSLRNLACQDGVLSLPIYLADHAVRLIENELSRR